MKYRSGYKYWLAEDETYEIPSWFPRQFRYDSMNDDFVHFTLKNLTIYKGFGWNGANSFPDFDWIMVPSKIHDAMLWVLFFNSHTYVDMPARFAEAAKDPGAVVFIPKEAGTDHTFKGWVRDHEMMSEDDYREMKHAIDRWFADECRARLPSWAKRTPGLMYLAVNRASKWVPGPDQAREHRILEVH